MAAKLRELSQTQKLQIATIVIISVLIIYGIGIETNFFANPIFSMFFIISYETAHTVVSSVAIVTALTIFIAVFYIWFIKKNVNISKVIELTKKQLVKRQIKRVRD